jgi:PTH2 family peptidyl-tRNA hydrolase
MGLVAELIRDAGKTQIPSGSVTALGIGPDEEEKIDKLVKDLKLL